jgi:outer membrane protein assembly factor BamB
LARERSWIFVWDKKQWVHLFNRLGARQGQVQLSAPLSAATCAEDGTAFAAVGTGGEVWWLAPDLSVRWSRSLPGPALAASMDAFGQYLAVSDERGNLVIFDHLGHTFGRTQTPRPLHYLAFVPAASRLIASADFGLVAGYDVRAQQLWRDGLVQNSGCLTVNGDGSTALLACYTEGLQRYSLDGKNRGRVVTPEPCYLASLSFDGRRVFAGSLNCRLLLLDDAGQVLAAYPVDKPPVAVALAAIGDYGVAVLKDGLMLCLDLSVA